ncbi:MAG: DUF4276 family protein [Raineya sp.]|nr:DUF4276 family protein [Raineya sp.]MDW8296382.1 DUF4276 family protein [Raineya sp.]
MQRILINCEGQTEQEFCQSLLKPYFQNINIFIETPIIKRSGGGIVGWEILKNQVEIQLKKEKNIYVTTFIDFFKLSTSYYRSEVKNTQNITDKYGTVQRIEEGMKNDIQEKLRERFIPYVQLHEFEALLFYSIEIFERWIPKNEFVDKDEILRTFNTYSNPELINDNKPPSKILQGSIQGYNKVLYGSVLALEIGLSNIRSKNPRFSRWIETLEKLPPLQK